VSARIYVSIVYCKKPRSVLSEWPPSQTLSFFGCSRCCSRAGGGIQGRLPVGAPFGAVAVGALGAVVEVPGLGVFSGAAEPASRLPSAGLLVPAILALRDSWFVRFADNGTRSAEFSWTVRTTVLTLHLSRIWPSGLSPP
jgi:hypothetical protein